MSKKPKIAKKDSLQKEIKDLEKDLEELKIQKDNFWSKNLESIQSIQLDKLNFLKLKLEKSISCLELTQKKVDELGVAGYYSRHHDVMSTISSVYSTCAHLSELKSIEDKIKEIIRKNAKKDSSSR